MREIDMASPLPSWLFRVPGGRVYLALSFYRFETSHSIRFLSMRRHTTIESSRPARYFRHPLMQHLPRRPGFTYANWPASESVVLRGWRACPWTLCAPFLVGDVCYFCVKCIGIPAEALVSMYQRYPFMIPTRALLVKTSAAATIASGDTCTSFHVFCRIVKFMVLSPWP